MKAYEIYDEEESLFIGVLLYYEKDGAFIVELTETLDEWNAPLLFTSFVKKHIFTIPRMISLQWVRERIIPSGRQNIKSILKNHRLKKYDELNFLELSEGRCSQDNIYVKKTNLLPDYVLDRQKKNVSECVVSDDSSLLCFFNDGTVKKVSLDSLNNIDGIDKIIKNKSLLESGKVATGGYSITFNDSIDISAADLYQVEKSLPLTKNDFISFIKKNVLTTTESCKLLKCSRQNLSYLVNQELLNPVKESPTGNLYLKGDILKNRW